MTGMLNPSGASGGRTVSGGSGPVGSFGEETGEETREEAREETGEAATRQAVREFLRRVMERDPDRIAALYAEEVDWMVAENPAVPGSSRARPVPMSPGTGPIWPRTP